MHSHSVRSAGAGIRAYAIPAAALLVFFVFTSLSWAQAAEGDLPFDPEAHHGTLSNGLTWYVKENREPLNRAQLRLAIRAGSVLEEEHERGLAHYVEHMAFDGTERFSGHEIIEYLESIPEPGTSLMIAGYPFEIVQTTGNAVRTARIIPALRRTAAQGDE